MIKKIIEEKNISIYKLSKRSGVAYATLNDIPCCTMYDDLRVLKLKKVVYPSSVVLKSRLKADDEIMKRTVIESIPEFIRFNIVESEVRNVYWCPFYKRKSRSIFEGTS